MALRVGFVSSAHQHAHAYVHGLRTVPGCSFAGIWDRKPERRASFATHHGIPEFESLNALLAECDAVVIASENKRHAEDIEAVAAANLHFICEKPIATTLEEAARIRAAVANHTGVKMTAFPCRYSPAYESLRARMRSGDIGTLRAICSTNRGTCPFDWFVDVAESGGGAMIDHVVHVTDLLRDLLQEEVGRVQAQTGNGVYAQSWEDTAMVTLEFPSGVFATIDSSWSRPAGFRTWGDVTLNVVGEGGVIEIDMFSQEVHRYGIGQKSHTAANFGSDLDALMIAEFLAAIQEGRPGRTTLEDGLKASEVAMAAYRSVQSREVASL